MRAIVVDEFGGPEQLRAAEVAIPVPGPGEVLVEIYAAPVNYVDLLVVGGTYQFLPERPFIPGKGPAGIVQVSYDDDVTAIRARAEWSPEFAIHDLDSLDELAAANPADFPDDVPHYLWAWADEPAGSVRARLFAANLGVAEDEATGSAAVRVTDYLSRDLTITQGKGSVIQTTWSPEGWVRVAGRVVDDGVRHVA